MEDKMTKEELGLPWEDDGSSCGYIVSSKEMQDEVKTDLAEAINYDIEDFILRAVNNHHALVEALEESAKKLHALKRLTIDDASYDMASKAHTKACDTLEAVK